MVIDKNSWHYKLLHFVKFDVAVDLKNGYNISLCQYFWSLIGALTLGVLVGTVLIFLTYMLINFILFIVTGLMDIPLSFVSLNAALAVLGVVVFIVPAFCIFCRELLGLNWFPDYMKFNTPINDKLKSIKFPKTPSVFKEMYKAHKSKFCPMLELQEEK